MKKAGVVLGGLAVLGVAVLGSPGGARGDVTVEKVVRTGGLGGFADSESRVVEKISGLSKRSVSSVEMKGKIGGFLGRFAGDLGQDEIVQIEQDRVVTLDHKEKTYTERSISLPKEEAGPGGGQGAGGGSEKTTGGDEGEPKVKILRNEITVKNTGDEKIINGFPCRRSLVTWVVEAEDLETGQRSKSTMTTDMWNTPHTDATWAVLKEELLFSKAYMKKMGLDVDPAAMKKFGVTALAGMMGGSSGDVEKKMKELEKKFAEIEGYSIATAVSWAMTGEGGEQKEAAEDSGRMDLSRGVGGLFSGLAKKAAEKSSKKEDPSPGGKPFFSSYSEVVKIDTSKIAASEFDVPGGYARK